ncbi:type II toxin-antitoxin system VapC family toxin [Trichloromonas sp.]|uniref:type II toxin-antitoxin system VapC family toxin n=1 Tax=Trichloromonas sp. TaxID=3069249 RepID=UPI002A4280CF|nr:PIN domain-containing protein [Trichloromonas sp.]
MDRLISGKERHGGLYALDTVTLIYYLERHPAYYPAARTLFEKIERGNISAVISTLVFAELLVPAYRAGQPQLAEKVTHILSHYPNLRVIPLSSELAAAAAQLRAEHQLRTPMPFISPRPGIRAHGVSSPTIKS